MARPPGSCGKRNPGCERLQIATVRLAATVEGSAARPSRPAAGTRPRRPYLFAMWVQGANLWAGARQSRTAFGAV